MSRFEASAREKIKTPILEGGKLCCPFCNKWRLSDSAVARKKLGIHLANDHADKVLFAAGTEPPDARNEYNT